MIKDLFTKKVLAVVCAATLSVGSIGVAFATSGYSLAPAAASASASAAATNKPEEPTTEEPTTQEPTTENPTEEPTTEAPTNKPEEPTTQAPQPSAQPSAAPSQEPTTDPIAEDTYEVLGSIGGLGWTAGAGLYMTQSTEDANIYTATILGVEPGEYEYQILKNGSWQQKYCGPTAGFADDFGYGNLSCTVEETCDVVITLDLSDMTVKTSVDEEKPVDDAKDMSAATVTLEKEKVTYNGAKQSPVVTSVTLGTATLVEGTDYTVETLSKKKVGTYTVKVNGTGAYKGTATAEFTIAKKSISNATATVGSKTYTGKKLTSSSYKLKLKLNGSTKTLTKDTDYTVKAASRTNVGSSTVTFTGKGNFKGTVTAKFTVNAKKISATKISVTSKKVYTGKALKASVTVKDGSTKLNSKSYSLTYKNNKKIGKATVTIKGKGNYTGSVSKTFKIVPGKVTIKSLKASKTTATLKFNSVKGATSYKVSYRVKGAKKWSTVTTKKTTVKLAKLKKGKTYQVKVTASAKSGKTTYTGTASATKTVKIKK